MTKQLRKVLSILCAIALLVSSMTLVLAEEADPAAGEAERITAEEAAHNAAEEAERKAEAEATRKAKEEAARKAEEEAAQKAREEAARKAEEEAAQKAREEAARKAEEEAARKAEEEAARKAEEEAARKAEEDAARKAEEEAARKAEEDAARKSEEEAGRKDGEEESRQADEEDTRKETEEENGREEASASDGETAPEDGETDGNDEIPEVEEPEDESDAEPETADETDGQRTAEMSVGQTLSDQLESGEVLTVTLKKSDAPSVELKLYAANGAEIKIKVDGKAVGFTPADSNDPSMKLYVYTLADAAGRSHQIVLSSEHHVSFKLSAAAKRAEETEASGNPEEDSAGEERPDAGNKPAGEGTEKPDPTVQQSVKNYHALKVGSRINDSLTAGQKGKIQLKCGKTPNIILVLKANSDDLVAAIDGEGAHFTAAGGGIYTCELNNVAFRKFNITISAKRDIWFELTATAGRNEEEENKTEDPAAENPAGETQDDDDYINEEMTDNGEEPADNAEEPTDNAEEPADNAEEPADNAEEPADNAEEPAGDAEEPADNAEEPADNAEEPADNAEEPDDNAEEPADNAEEPAGDAEEPAEDAEEPAGDAEEPAEDAEEPAGDAEEPAEDAEEPAEDAEEPAAEDEENPAGETDGEEEPSEEGAEDEEPEEEGTPEEETGEEEESAEDDLPDEQEYRKARVQNENGAELYDSTEEGAAVTGHADYDSELWIRDAAAEGWAEVRTEDETRKYVRLDDIRTEEENSEDTEEAPEEDETSLTDEEMAEMGYRKVRIENADGADLWNSTAEDAAAAAHADYGTELWIRDAEAEGWAEVYTGEENTLYIRPEDIEGRQTADEQMLGLGYCKAQVIRQDGADVYAGMDVESAVLNHLDAGTEIWVRVMDGSEWALLYSDSEEEAGYIRCDDIVLVMKGEDDETGLRCVTITCSLGEAETVFYGTPVQLTATLENFQEDDAYTVQWMYSEDDEATYQAIEEANELVYEFVVEPENIKNYWKIEITLLPKE